MKICISKSKTMDFRWKRVESPLWIGGEVVFLLEEFKYLGYLFMNEGETEQEIDRQIGVMTAVTERCTGLLWWREMRSQFKVFKEFWFFLLLERKKTFLCFLLLFDLLAAKRDRLAVLYFFLPCSLLVFILNLIDPVCSINLCTYFCYLIN